jgi:hypothetical protein
MFFIFYFLVLEVIAVIQSEDRNGRYLWKVSTFLPNYTESHVTRQQSSKSHHHVEPRSRRRIAAVDPPPRASGQSGTGKDFSPSTSFLACQYHSTNAPYSYFIHLLSTLYELQRLPDLSQHTSQPFDSRISWIRSVAILYISQWREPWRMQCCQWI